MTKKERESLAARIRRAIQESGNSLNAIERATGVDHSRLSRFMSGKRTLTLDAAERIAAVLGLELCPRKER